MENVETRRGLLIARTVVSAVLAAPAVFLAVFTIFSFDDPNAGAWAWVMATPWFTLPVTVVIAPFVSWVLDTRRRYSAAINVATLPIAHLLSAMLVFAIVASVV